LLTLLMHLFIYGGTGDLKNLCTMVEPILDYDYLSL